MLATIKKSYITLIILFCFCTGCSKTQVPIILEQDYSFLGLDGDISKLIQSKDTLFEKSFFADTIKYNSRRKILSITRKEEFSILKLESIDTIPVSQSLCPGKTYSIISFKKTDNKQLEINYLQTCLTRTELDAYQINLEKLNNKEGLLYLSDSYLEKLSHLKSPSRINDIRKILNSIENNDYNLRKISYSANELNKACIRMGYNPVNATHLIDSLM